MKDDKHEPTTYCHSCGRDILTPNFLIHEGRCQRMSELRSSRVSEKSENHQTIYGNNNHFQHKIQQPRREPYSFSKMNLKEDLKSKSVKRSVQTQNKQKIPCPFCGYMQTLAQLDTHPNECQHREIECNFCGVKYPQSLMDDHVMICQKNPQNIQRNNRSRSRMRRNQPHEFQSQDEYDNLPMIFHPQNRNMYRPSSLMDLFNREFLSPRMETANLQNYRSGPTFHMFQFSAANGGQPRVIIRSNSTNPSTFIQLIEMLARRANPNENPGLSQQELSQLPKIKYHKKGQEPDLCTICYCQFEENEQIIQLKCRHLFHQQCIFEWLKRVSTCPVCKKKLKERHPNSQQQFESFQNAHHSSENRHPQGTNRQQGGFFDFLPF